MIEAQNEIRRLHTVCRIKDRAISKAIEELKRLNSIAESTHGAKEQVENVKMLIIELQDTIG
jgi:predicted RecB family endonuclease